MSPTTKDGRSKKRPGLTAQREAVVAAAVALFAEQGVEAVSISRICTAADVSRPTFYRCFPDKDALLRHIYTVAVDDHTRLNLAAVLDGDAPRGPAAIRAALDDMVDRIFERPLLAAFIFVESADVRAPAHAIVREAHEEAARRIEQSISAGGARPPTRTTLLATMAACQWIAHDAIRRGLTPEVRADARAAMWALVAAVFRLSP